MNVKNWFDEKGDETLALDWDLNENSRVWEIGGFEGRWAQQIWDKFHCHITIFEPQLWAVYRMQERFKDNDKITILPHGIWTETKVLPIGNFETDGATVMTSDPGKPSDFGYFRNLHDIFLNNLFAVDVCLMNIEGAEYVLLPEFIRIGFIKTFNNFWCQFHIKDDMESEKTEKIFKGMERTHDLLWNCYPTAVAWRRRK